MSPFVSGKLEADDCKFERIKGRCKCGKEFELIKDMPFAGWYNCTKCYSHVGFVYEPRNASDPNDDQRASRIISALDSIVSGYSERYGNVMISSVSMSQGAYVVLHGYFMRNVITPYSTASQDTIMGIPIKVVEDQQVDIIFEPEP